MSWKSEVYLIIKQVCPVGSTFSLNDIYKYREHFKSLYPNNKHIDEKIRQILQFIRDDGKLEFCNDYGIYKLIK